jgi:hypothetical protein
MTEEAIVTEVVVLLNQYSAWKRSVQLLLLLLLFKQAATSSVPNTALHTLSLT